MSKPPKENLVQGAAYVLGRFSSLKDLKCDPKHMPHPVTIKNLFQIEKFYQKIIPEYFDGTFWDLLSGNSTSQNSNVIFQLSVS